MKQHRLLTAFFCVLSPLAQADTDINIDEVVVTATRIEQPLKQTLSSTSVITQEDIKNSQAADVPSILRSVAGVEISQSGGTGNKTSLFLRGSNDTQVLVLLDGVRINSATYGTTSLEHLMLDQIERIEVVRGNVSSLYGSEAIGGVVQIFTKRGHGAPAFNASAGAGSHGTQRLSAGLGGSSDNTDFSVQASRFRSDGVSAIDAALSPNANPDNDGYHNTSVSANVRHAFNADHSLSASVFNSQGHNQYDNAFGAPTDANDNDVRVSKLSLVAENRLGGAWLSKLQLAQGTDSYQDFTNGAPALNWLGLPSSKFQTDNIQLSWQNLIRLDAARQLLVGAEYLDQQVSSDMQPAYVQTERKINSLFAGYTANYGAHRLQANLRQDNNSQYGAANTGLLGYGYALTDAWRATASYSTAFRAPTFNELYYPGYGNANLRPEQSRNTEAGLHYAANEQNVDIVYFDNRTRDLINAVLVDPATFTYQAQNVDDARIDGLELGYAGQFGDTGVKAAAVVQNPRDLSNNRPLPRRAIAHGSAAATQKLGALQLGAEWLYSDARPDSTKTLQAYHVFNLTAAYAVDKQLKLSLRADNLTDQNDASVYGYNPVGRTLFVSMSYQQ